jgi:uncharacterized protein (DUF2236 family)
MVGGGTTTQRPLTDGLYGPGSTGWRLNREAGLLLGAGPRALLLQVAHPLVAEGVDQHSGFREDPWSRLAGTLRSYLRIVYGTMPAARVEITRLNRLHARVTGPVRDDGAAARHGPTYRALDPVLALWVHATLVDSTLVAVDAWQERLDHATRAAFYAETVPVGRLFGVPDELLPQDIDAFDSYMRVMLAPDGPVHPTATACELAAAILRPPLAGVLGGRIGELLGPAAPAARRVLALVPQPAVDALMIPAIGLLPVATRDEYGLKWGPLERAIDAWLVAGWQFWRPRLPATFRWFPQAIAADARVARASDVTRA